MADLGKIKEITKEIWALKKREGETNVLLSGYKKERIKLQHTLEDMLNEEELTSYKLPGECEIKFLKDEYYKYPEEISDRIKLFNYVKAKYGEEEAFTLFKMNSISYNTFAKEEINSGGAYTPELPTQIEKVSIRKA